MEHRLSICCPALICSCDGSHKSSPAVVDNISSHGARVRVAMARPLHERVEFKDTILGWQVVAEVVYCQIQPDGHFAIGLKFQDRIEFPGLGGYSR